MHINDLIDRILKLERTGKPGDLVVPERELIAFNIRCTRRLMNLKKSALAHLAGVSLSTVERIENAEPVSTDCLDKIAVFFGEKPGYFTAPRPLQTSDDGLTAFIEKTGQLEAVPVKHLTTQPQVRELAHCHSFVVNAPDLDEFSEEIRGLVEWLDLTAFVVGPYAPPSDRDEGGRRELYADVLNAVSNFEKQGVTVLASIVQHPQYGIEDWKVAILHITRKATDPGAIERKFIFVDKRALTRPAGTSAIS